jgi:hypothetical protein
MFDFNEALAGMNDHIRALMMVDIEVSPPDVHWRTVRGYVTEWGEEQTFEGMGSRFAETVASVELDMADYEGRPVPAERWLVRYRDELRRLKVRMIGGPLAPTDTGSRFMGAGLKELDYDDDRGL